MTGSEAKYALLARVPIVFEGAIYKRIAEIVYKPTQDLYKAHTNDRITVICVLEGIKGSGTLRTPIKDVELLQPMSVKQGTWDMYDKEWQEKKEKEVKEAWEIKYYGKKIS